MKNSTFNYITVMSLLDANIRILIARYMATNDKEEAADIMREIKSMTARKAELKIEQRKNMFRKFTRIVKGH